MIALVYNNVWNMINNYIEICIGPAGLFSISYSVLELLPTVSLPPDALLILTNVPLVSIKPG